MNHTGTDAEAINRSIGPFYTADSLAPAMGLTEAQLVQLVTDGVIVGVHSVEGDLVVPTRQFRDRLEPAPNLPALVRILRHGLGEWTIAQWVLAPAPSWEGLCAIDLIFRGWSYPVLLEAWRDVMRWSDNTAALEEPAGPVGWDWDAFDPTENAPGRTPHHPRIRPGDARGE
ncbi:hypothetical protein ASC63_14630 [Leifsonia sp. Root112D2]|nr:hypothetical protein ASC63_14630 [Leifsonia sp. Root112D2]